MTMTERCAKHAAAMEAIGRRWLDAFNRRDGDALVAMADAAITLDPSPIAGVRRVRVGHAELRRWLAEIDASPLSPQARIREVRLLDVGRVLLSCDLLVAGEPVAPLTGLIALGAAGLVVELRGYLGNDVP